MVPKENQEKEKIDLAVGISGITLKLKNELLKLSRAFQ